MEKHPIVFKKAAVHNLKKVDLSLNSRELIVFTGVSGSGKSSMAFDTIFNEGQRRYIESLSTFARRFLGDMSKPDVESVSGLSPTIAIEQKSAGKNPRSTVGTMTEIYDYLRVLYARVGQLYCPVTKEKLSPESKERIIKKIQNLPEKSRLIFFAPYAKNKKGEFKEDFQLLLRRGYMRARCDGEIIELTEEIALDKNQTHNIDIVIDRLLVTKENISRIAEAVMTALEMGNGVFSLLNQTTDEETLYSTHAYSPKADVYYTSLEPTDFSFNNPSAMCPTCHGLGISTEYDLNKIIDPEKSVAQNCCIVAGDYLTVRYGNIYRNLSEIYDFDINTVWKDLSAKAQKVLLYGTRKKWTAMHFVHPEKGSSWTEYVAWRGWLADARKKYQEAKSDLYKKKMEKLMTRQLCSSCQGSRLLPLAQETKVGGLRIHDFCALTIEEAHNFCATLTFDKSEALIAVDLVREIQTRLQFLLHVGLNYLCLNRSSPTLSGGEAQRVRLASQVGCGLVGVTYILDEPSIGLHPRDNTKLISTLKNLRDMGNTVIVVEHDEETIRAADRIVDFGPGPGCLGGEIIVNGDLETLLSSHTLTGDYLSGRKKIGIPTSRRTASGSLKIFGASHHNLKEIDVTIPLGVFVAVTGVSGSGKSSLIIDTLVPALVNKLHHGEQIVGAHHGIEMEGVDKIIAIDQSPIGRNPRSNPATYIKLFDEIRSLFSQLPEAQAKGFLPGRFSFNVAEGSCPQCKGHGYVRVDMDFLEDQWVVCSACNNRRFDSETLNITYKGKNIYDVLEMSVDEAFEFFENIPSLQRKLAVIAQVGMGYIKLGQPSPTLSGGEAQRIKLAKELVRPASGHTLYVLDEPTTGLHFHDISALLTVLDTLVDRGNTVLVIEHNMDVVKRADHIIDIGPEAGSGGGEIVATGTPEEIAQKKTATGVALKAVHKNVEKIEHEVVKEIPTIEVRGAEQNNLKHLDISIPRLGITVACGPSGSGKSSFAFETVYAEGQRRYIESLSPYARQFVHQMPKPKLSQISGLSPAVSIEQKASSGNPRSTVGTQTEIYDYLRILFAACGTAYCPETGEKIESITKDEVVDKILAFPENTPLTLLAPFMVHTKEQFATKLSQYMREGYLRLRLNNTIYEIDEEIPFDPKRKNTLELVVDRLKVHKKNRARIFEAVEKATNFSAGEVIALTDKEHLFNLSFSVQSTGKSYSPITPHIFSFNSAEGMCPECQGLGYQYGANLVHDPDILSLSVIGFFSYLMQDPHFSLLTLFLEKENISPKTPLKKLSSQQLQRLMNGAEEWLSVKKHVRVKWNGIQPLLAMAGRRAHRELRQPLIPLLDEIECISCFGSRLRPLARHVRIQEHSIATLCAQPIEKIRAFIDRIDQPKMLAEVFSQLKSRLQFLIDVGLGYLALNRRAPTLSNGEAQRIKLARQLGSELCGILYVLDEPTIGLHPSDNEKLSRALFKLKELGNTLLLVEHDPLTIAMADHILDFGPGAGIHGGHITAQGNLKEILEVEESLTGAYLSGRKKLPLFPKKRPSTFFTIEGAKSHNLKNITVSIPIGLLTCLTGVSGSGKSTLMREEIIPKVKAQLDSGELFAKMLIIDQDPIGQTVRADVGTYTDLLPELRKFFAALGMAKTKGLQSGHFSYNHKKGMCSNCWGLGYKKVEMLFLSDVKVPCDHCHGLRLNPVSLQVEYQGKNFGQFLQISIEEARHYFELLPKFVHICNTLIELGLGYLKLGQEIATLSGGEAQRIKLSRELAKKARGKTLYLLDEPTTGLHPDDICKLLYLLSRLTDKGHTVLVIEHHTDFIKRADYMIDLGPGAGAAGGELLYSGPVENAPISSPTGKFLLKN
ncbi:MAG: excinuclease ABC subunit UvrA [Chlamydiales bacterium]